MCLSRDDTVSSVEKWKSPFSASSKTLHLLPVLMSAVKKQNYANIIVSDARILKLFEAGDGLEKNPKSFLILRQTEISLSFFHLLSSPIGFILKYYKLRNGLSASRSRGLCKCFILAKKSPWQNKRGYFMELYMKSPSLIEFT